MPPLVNRSEYISIGPSGSELALATPAYWVQDPTPLLDAASVRGSDRIIPFTAGQQALPRIRDELRVQLPLIVIGQKDNTGAATSNPRSGLTTNLAVIKTNLGTPSSSGDGTFALTYHLTGGSTLTSTCFVIPPFQWTAITGFYAYKGVLDLILPTGLLS